MYLVNVRIVNTGGKMSRAKTPARPAPTMESEVVKMKTIEEVKEMPRNDGYNPIPTVGETEGMMGEIERW